MENLSSKHKDVLTSVFEAFNRHDIDGIMRHFDDQVVFETIAGNNQYGGRVEGIDAVAAAFENVWKGFPDVQWRNPQHMASDDRGLSEWTFTATAKDGLKIEADGCDLFRFKDGLIVEKKAFRKSRPPFK